MLQSKLSAIVVNGILLAPESVGRRVEVTAKVAVDDEKRVYLEFVDGHPL
jgi:hypothetical protein